MPYPEHFSTFLVSFLGKFKTISDRIFSMITFCREGLTIYNEFIDTDPATPSVADLSTALGDILQSFSFIYAVLYG